jgi:hypothetical protein
MMDHDDIPAQPPYPFIGIKSTPGNLYNNNMEQKKQEEPLAFWIRSKPISPE